MKVTNGEIRSLCKWGKNTDYRVVGVESVTKTVSHEIPLTTGVIGRGFPIYLFGFEKYYTDTNRYKNGGYWILKSEYIENRPRYSITVTYNVLDVEFTKHGKEEIARRYNLHKRNMEKYARLMG